jgi:WD40 repeat protein
VLRSCSQRDKSRCLFVAEGHKNVVRCVAFSPDGKQIVSGSDDRTICIWDAASGRLIGSPSKPHNSFVTSVIFSPDRNGLFGVPTKRNLALGGNKWSTH